MNKAAFALTILGLNLDEWEPIAIENKKFAIRHRKTNIYIGFGDSLQAAILAARKYTMKKLTGELT